MLKVVLVVLVLLGAAWGYPPTRTQMAHALLPVAERLGPAGEYVSRPVRRYNARTEISFVLDQIAMARTEGRPTPTGRSFQEWLKARVKTKNNGKDIWGNEYYLTVDGTTFTVGSVGPDGERNSPDDITKSKTF